MIVLLDCAQWRGWCIYPQAFQMVVKGNFGSLLVLNKKIEVCMGWDVSPPMGHVVSCKKLRDKGLHTFKGMIGYCMKNNGNKYFEFVHHNVSADDMNGKMEHAKFRKVGLNDRVSLSHSNVLQRPINGLISV